MSLESCMILMDCSQYMRNGDYVPTRLAAQEDAANLLVNAKIQSHRESTVGVAAGAELLVSPTTDVSTLLSAVHTVTMSPSSHLDIVAAVAVASLALKHRCNKNGAQRIVLFVGTPIQQDSKLLQRAGRQLKKNNVAIDVVAMGELEINEAKLQELVDAANGRIDASEADRNCHLITIPPGVLPSDVLASSPILSGSAGGMYATASATSGETFDHGGGSTGNAYADFGGVDPNMDPELAMVLRVSMEEERARQERAAAAASASSSSESDIAMVDAATTDGLSEEDALLQQALAMSMNENDPQTEEDSKPAAAAAAGTTTANDDVDVEMDEDAAMQMALQMSMAAEQQQESSTQVHDPAFLQKLLKDMPGVDPEDVDIQELLRQAEKKKHQKDDKNSSDDSKKE